MIKRVAPTLIIGSALAGLSFASWAQTPVPADKPTSAQTTPAQSDPQKPPAGNGTAPAEDSHELDWPVDDTVKLTVDPVQVSNLVDRIMEPVSLTVRCPSALSAQFFMIPVDAPYGGRALGKVRSIGSDDKPEDGLSVHWTEKISAPYVKLFAVVRKKNAPNEPVRSRTYDFSIGGARYQSSTSR